VNIAMLLEMAAEGDPDRVVLGSHHGGITASDLLERCRRAAIYFEKSGAEVVGYFGLNEDTLPVALFGAALAGIPFAPLNYRAPDEQLRGILGRVAGGIMIADDQEVERLNGIGATNVLTKDEFAAAIAEPVTAEHPFVDPEEIAVLLFTSGTTSEPKAAILRHRHLVSYIISSVEFLGCEPTEAQLICVPSYHIAGIAAVLSSLYAGRRIMYLPAFEAGPWVQLAADEHVTHAMVVPTMLGRSSGR
jgi:fatty-acyl-CoA synthase